MRWIEPGSASGLSILGDLTAEYRSVRRRSGRWTADLWYLGQATSIAAGYGFRTCSRRFGASLRGVGLDLRASMRSLSRAPGLLVVAVLSLVFGIGFTGAAVTAVDAVWYAPLPWPESDRLVDLEDTHGVEVCNGCSPGTSYDAWQDWRELGVFESSAAFRSRTARLGTEGSGRSIEVGVVAGDAFGLLDLPFARGRALPAQTADSDQLPAVVVSHGLFVSEFGAAPDIVGRSLVIDGVSHVVVGVLAETARTLDRAQAWISMESTTVERGYDARGLWVVARLADGVSVDAAHAAVSAAATSRFAADPNMTPGWSARVTPLREVLARETGEPAAGVALVVTGLLVLLITTFNLASVLVARVMEREVEFGVRAALGAGRARIARAALADAALLSGIGGLGGVWAGMLALRALTRRFSGVLPGWVGFEPNLRIVMIAAGTVLLTALACGLLPLLRALELGARAGVADRIGRRTRVGRMRTLDGLLAAQVAMGVILVAGSLSSLRTLVRVSDFDTLGYRWDGITSVHVDLPGRPGADEGRDVEAAIAAHPGVERVALMRSLFLGSWGTETDASPVHVDGRAEAVPNAIVPRHSAAVGPGYFDLFEIPLLAGRAIEAADGPGAPGAAVVSLGAAHVMWPGTPVADVPGSGFTLDDGTRRHPFTVVGVVADVVTNPGSESRRADPRIYTALARTPATLLEATPGSELIVQIDVRGVPPGPQSWQEVISAAVPGGTVTHVTTVEAGLRRWIGPTRITGWIFSGLAALALALLGLGVFGTVSYRMAVCRRELGIRVALGARPRWLIGAALGRLGKALGAALVVGMMGAGLAHRVGGAGLPLGGGDAGVLGAVGLLLAVVTVVAAALPLRRALASDPVDSLRTE